MKFFLKHNVLHNYLILSISATSAKDYSMCETGPSVTLLAIVPVFVFFYWPMFPAIKKEHYITKKKRILDYDIQTRLNDHG